jgi:transcriptional regulator with XRE-family HTH domain
MISDEQRTFFIRLGKRIASLRNQHGLTQTRLAEILGVSQKSVNAFEHGNRRVPVSMLPLLANALGVSIEDLLSDGPTRHAKRGPASKLERQIELIRHLPRAKQKFVTDFLDNVLGSADQGG